MTIKSITNAALNLPIIDLISSLIQRTNRVIQKNDDAKQEAQMVAMTVTAGTGFGLFGRAVVMLATRSFSFPSLLFYALIGGTAGILANGYTIYSFFSKLKIREA
jgi:hypothetical protein